MAADLFAAAAAERLAARAPLAARLRPRRLDDLVGQRHLLGPGKPLRVLVEGDRLRSVILWGPAGTGKTTLAEVVAATTAKTFVALSAVSATVADVRRVLDEARRRLGETGAGTILFLDEVHRFNRAQQDALLPGVEQGLIVLVGATTENPLYEVNGPLRSRATLFRLEPLAPADLEVLVQRGLDAEGAEADDDAVDHLVGRAAGDGRAVLTTLEVAVALAEARTEGEAGAAPARVTLADAEAAAGMRALRHGRDEHYDVLSAFIKSVRGSDPDAALYWLARLLEAGEDPRVIARRLLVSASEDIGMADPQGLVVAAAAATALEHVGLPEARLNLAHAAVYLACAPKSNRVYAALGRAAADVADGPAGEVPPPLRDTSHPGARRLGHGVGYRYPHDHPDGFVEQSYRPAVLADRRYYEPSSHGFEGRLAQRWPPLAGRVVPDAPQADGRGGTR